MTPTLALRRANAQRRPGTRRASYVGMRRTAAQKAYHPGDYVIPADLPCRPLCRVDTAERAEAGDGPFQILTLAPLEDPHRAWPNGHLVRLAETVRPARTRDLWRPRQKLRVTT